MYKKIVIKDTLSNEYYCVRMTQQDPNTGAMTVGENDFPYWSSYIEDAYDFKVKACAMQEIDNLDLAACRERCPIILDNTKKVFEYTTVTNGNPRFIIAESEIVVRDFFFSDPVDYIKERTNFTESNKKGIFEI